jgi:hypothetical protein
MRKRAAAIGALVAGVTITAGSVVASQGGTSHTRALIPGVVATPAPAIAQLCVPGYTRTVRPPESYTTQLKIAQLSEGAYPDQNPADYEEDHLISLEIGGDPRSEQNLWPQKWPEARVKDKQENALHRAVCGGTMSLGEAQAKILADWGPHR